MKICPYCESELSDTARKCKFCWEWVNTRLFKGNNKYLSNNEFIECLWRWAVEIEKIEYITDEQVDILFNSNLFNSSSLELNWLKEITNYQLENLSKFKWLLFLDWLKKLTNEQCEILSKFKWIELSLNWLTNLTDEQFILLTKPFVNSIDSVENEKILHIEWLEEITDKQAEYFSNCRWYIRLLSLKKITNKQLELFTKFWGDYLYFKINDNKIEIKETMIDYWNEIWCYVDLQTTIYWLSWIKNEQLKILVGWGGIVTIKTDKITDSQATIISHFLWTYIFLEWTSITDMQAEILSKFTWEKLRISWNISEKQKTIMTKYDLYINDDEQGINDYIFDKRIDENNDINWKGVIHVKSHINNKTLRLFFFDTETTWKDPHNEQIIQFWWIYWIYDMNLWKFEEKDRINQLVKPSKKIPEEASKVHWLYNKDLEEYGFIDEYIDEFLSFIKKADFVVWHNVEYDKTVLIAETKRLNIPFDFSKIKWIDTMKPCASLVQIPAPERSKDKYKWPKLMELHKFLFWKEFEDAHDAMADITATKDCFVELCNKYNFYENWKFKEEIERYQNENKGENVTNEEIKQKDISEMHKEFQELQHITNKLWEAQSKIKNVECVYNNETWDIRYRIDGDYYNDNDIVNVDGYVFLKKYVVEFNWKPYIKSHNDLYEFQDIEGTDKFNWIPKKWAKSVAKRVITVSSWKLIWYFKPEDVVVVDWWWYFPKKEAIKIKFNGKDYFFRSDDDYVLNKYLKKDWNGNFCLKSNCSIIDETDTKWYYWVKCSWSILDKTIVQWLIYLWILIALFYFWNR